MRTKLLLKSMFCAAVLMLSVSMQTKAQSGTTEAGTFDLSGHWQFNAPLSNKFSDKASGWGAGISGYYNLTDNLSAGVFMSWNTNNEYVPRQTYTGENVAVNMDSQNSLFQLPFGVGARYKLQLMDGMLTPYVGARIGTSYAKMKQYSNIYGWTENKWGFYMSPEIGVMIYPFASKQVGFNLGGYYSYSTNKFDQVAYQKGLNNVGFTLGAVVKID